MRTDIVRPSLIEENVAPMIVYRVWVRDACDDWWGGPDLNELSCCMIGKYDLALHISLNSISMGGQLISRILYNLADVIKNIPFNIIMILSDFISKR